MRDRSVLRNERGLTLAEILAAVAIIGIALTALAAVVPVASSAVQDGYQLSTATFLAQQRIEQARNATWTAIPGVDCLGVGTATTQPTTGTGCAAVAPALGAGAVTFPDEANVQWGNDARAGTSTAAPLANGYTRTTRITPCTVATCGALSNPPTTTEMRLVTVTVRYRPLTAAGVSPTTKPVVLQWVAAQR